MLSQGQITDFFQRGFFLLPQLFSSSEIEGLKPFFDELYRRSLDLNETTMIEGTQFVVERKALQRAVWVGAMIPQLLTLGRDPRILQPVSELLGSTQMDHLINQAHFKMPGDFVDFKWHQDSEHRRFGTPQWNDVNGKGSYVQTVLAIDAITENNGPLLFIPESPKWGHIGEDLRAHPHKYFQEENSFALTMNPGDLAIFGPYTIHSSRPNESKTPRRVLINGFSSPGANARVYPGEGAGKRISL